MPPVSPKKKPAAPAAPAPALFAAKELQPYLRKVMASLGKRLSLTRMAVLFEIADLAWYLTALERHADAASIVDYLGLVPFTGNHNLWSPASLGLSLGARLARLAGQPARRAALVGRLVENPAYATVQRVYFEQDLARVVLEIDRARAEKTQKLACRQLARALGRVTYFRETAGHGFYYDTWLDTAAVDAQLDRGLVELRARLA